MGWKWQKSGDSVRKGIKKVPFSHVIATFFVFSLVSGEMESCLVGKSGREIWISVFAMIISCPELVKIKRGNKIKEVRSGVVGMDGGTVGARSRADGMDGGRVGAHSWMMGTVSWMKSMASRRMGTTSWRMATTSWRRGMAGGTMMAITERDGVRSGVAMRAAVG